MRHRLADTPPQSARRHRRRPRVGAVAALVVAGWLALAAPAAAHDALVGSDPAADATLTAAPSQVVLTFSAAQAGVGSEVAVTGADGQLWSDGPAQVVDATVTQPLTAPLPNGAYTVTWRSVAGDGHPVTGTFGFTVAVPAASPTTDPQTPTATPTPTTTPTATPTPSPTASTAAPTPAQADDPAAPEGGGGRAWVWAAVVAACVAVAVAALVARRRTVGT